LQAFGQDTDKVRQDKLGFAGETVTLQQLLRIEINPRAAALAAPDRARILERLIESFDGDTKINEAWLDEALRREEEVVSGRVAMVPGREALARIRAQLA